MKILRKILRFIYKIPNQELTWTVKDYKKAVSILKRYDNPENTKKSLWSKFNNPWFDSVDVLNEANIIIRNSQQI